MIPGDTNEAAYFAADGVLDGFSPISLSTTTQNMLLTPSGTGVVGQVIRSLAGQTANLQEWQDSSSDIGGRINSNLEFSNPSIGSGVDNELFGDGAGSGFTVVSTGNSNTLLGKNAGSVLVGGSSNVVIGKDSTLFNSAVDNTVVIGVSASAFTNGISIGQNAIGSNTGTICIGRSSTGSGLAAIVIGESATGNNNNSIALGLSATTTAVNQWVVGAETSPILNAYFGEGVVSTTPGDFTLHSTGGSGTDIAGASLTFAGGQGTGTGIGGDVVIQHAPVSGTGSTPNTLVDVLTVSDGLWSLGNTAEGGTARINYKTTHETHTLTLGATSDTTAISIPSGARLLGVSMNVDTAVTDDAGDDTWSAAFITGSTTTIVTGAAAAQNTKVDFIVPDEKTTAVTEIQFTPNAGNFSAGVIEIVAYYEELISLANAA